MKEYFLVNKDVKLRENGEWQQPSEQYLLSAAALIEKRDERLFVIKSRKKAEKFSLDNSHLESDERFFPIYRVLVSDKLKGLKDELKMSTGNIPALGFHGRNLTITDVYLSHIHESLKDIKVEQKQSEEKLNSTAANSEFSDDEQLGNLFGDDSEVEAPVKTNDNKQKRQSAPAPTNLTKYNLRQYVPSLKSTVKNGLPFVVAGTAFYFGNDALTALAANYSIPLAEGLTASAAYLPEAVASSPALLPVAAGIGTRVAVEVPEVSASLFSKAWSGLKSLANKTSETFTTLKDRWKERREKAAQAKAAKTVTTTVTSKDVNKHLSKHEKSHESDENDNEVEVTVAKDTKKKHSPAVAAKKRLSKRSHSSKLDGEFEIEEVAKPIEKGAAAAKARLKKEKKEKKERKPIKDVVFTTPESSSPPGSHVEEAVIPAAAPASALLPASDLLQRLDALTSTSAPQTEEGEVITTTQPTLTKAYDEAAAASTSASELNPEGVSITPPGTPPLEPENRSRSSSPVMH